MKYLPTLGCACTFCFASSAIADVEFSVGANYLSTTLNESRLSLGGLFNDVSIDDDSDSGYDLFIRAEWSSLLNVKLGYADHGEFSFVGGGLFVDEEDFKGTIDVEYLYLAWSPRWHITDRFALSGSVGAVSQDIDINNETGDASIDYGEGGYFALDAEYRFTEHLGGRTEAGYISGSELDSYWFGLGVAYYF